ncbi:MAG: putative selenate reductase subunit YgfK [Sphaerochaetaceae bacterium]
MGDIMRPVGFLELLNRIFGEYKVEQSIFGIDQDQFYEDKNKHSIKVFGQSCSTPFGPAAGPHTQLSQNIISSYLTGGRFIELKTVQIMDNLSIEKPCIDARDEGYNVEWSTEFTLEKAYDEYLKAWMILNLFEALNNGGNLPSQVSFIFNMSVGYNLDGIKKPKMQTFINNMMDSTKSEKFIQYKEDLEAWLAEEDAFDGTEYQGMEKALEGFTEKINPVICQGITISTMHGCPPEEIEAICSYMLKEKHINTFVKLNPTLLGYDEVRKLTQEAGFGYIGLTRENFEKDLQYKDAVEILTRLMKLAEKEKKQFGVKLTNTLGSINNQGFLPGDEMYMSGRALLPISVKVAAKLSRQFNGKLPVSYSGGANAFTALDLFETGIRPITLATDMLKPGGYARLRNLVEIVDKESKTFDAVDINVEKLEALAEKVKTAEYLNKAFRGTDRAKVNDELEMFDCFVAPCQVACPIHQQIPEYIGLVGMGRYAEALEIIYEENALPGITCTICDHQCQYSCSRMDYEGAVEIREMKKVAFEKGREEFLSNWKKNDTLGFATSKVAIVGSGPAGLSAAYFLAREGFEVTVFEREKSAGGVVNHIIPEFRIDREVIESDVEFIKMFGVKFNFGVDSEDVTAEALKEKGFDVLLYAIGSEKGNQLNLEGEKDKIISSLDFLASYRKKKENVTLGENVVICGGGNTAMDSARAALRVKGVKKVCVVYRRGEKEMPADREEYELAVSEGVEFYFLANPEKIENGKLVCRVQKLGESDSSGRKRPEPTEKTFVLKANKLIAAIGEKADDKALKQFGICLTSKLWPEINDETNETEIKNVFAIGDVATGPSTVVRCIASARKACEEIIDRDWDKFELDHMDEEDEAVSEGFEDEREAEYDSEEELDEEYYKAENAFFEDIKKRKASFNRSLAKNSATFAENEAKRCIDCAYICNKCVDVCPNRANVAIDVRDCDCDFVDAYQIVHLDAYCNECGNCATFCNHNGKPYKDKFTIFSRMDDFNNSENSGFYYENGDLVIRINQKIYNGRIDGNGKVVCKALEDYEVKCLIEEILLDYSYLLGSVEE